MDNGVVVDLNRITRREFRQFRNELKEIPGDDIDRREEITAGFYAKVISEWPHGPVSAERYLELGLKDAAEVDRVVGEAMELLSEKPGEKK